MALLRRKAPLLRRMELRAKTRLKRSVGTVVPEWLRNYVFARDGGCLGLLLGFPGECWGPLDPDHVRSSGGIGIKSPTEKWNLATLCRWHHQWKTEHPLAARPLLLTYLDRVEPSAL